MSIDKTFVVHSELASPGGSKLAGNSEYDFLEDIQEPNLQLNQTGDSTMDNMDKVSELKEHNNNSGINAFAFQLPELPDPVEYSCDAVKEFSKSIREQTLEEENKLKKELEKKNIVKAELLAMKARIRDLQERKLKLAAKVATKKQEVEQEMLIEDQKIKKAEEDIKISTRKLHHREKDLEKIRKRFEEAEQAYKDVCAEDQQLADWTQHHCIKIVEVEDASSEDEVTNDAKTKPVFVLNNINPKDREQNFHILFQFIDCESKTFMVKNVCPEFEESSTVIERANESQDLCRLLKDCRKAWLQQCEKSLPGKSFDSPQADASMDLFDATSCQDNVK